jgi:hypothetical protein
MLTRRGGGIFQSATGGRAPKSIFFWSGTGGLLNRDRTGGTIKQTLEAVAASVEFDAG